MKTIGLLGGMSYKSSLEYYRVINAIAQKTLGGWHSAKVILYSVDFDEIDLEHNTKGWKKSDAILINAAQKLEKAGADFLVICANTAHTLYDNIQDNINIPVLHIADAVAEKIKAERINTVGLLGTKFTMQENFYKGRLEEKHGLKVIVPNQKTMDIVNKEINGIILEGENPHAKHEFVNAINDLVNRGAEAVILGCTEIPLVIHQEDVDVPLFDTTAIHAESAFESSLKE